jgi:hypothetical protein
MRRERSDVAVVLVKKRSCLTLTLLVAGVLADHHDAAVATNHLALVTDLLHARVDLHRESLFGI